MIGVAGIGAEMTSMVFPAGTGRDYSPLSHSRAQRGYTPSLIFCRYSHATTYLPILIFFNAVRSKRWTSISERSDSTLLIDTRFCSSGNDVFESSVSTAIP